MDTVISGARPNRNLASGAPRNSARVSATFTGVSVLARAGSGQVLRAQGQSPEVLRGGKSFQPERPFSLTLVHRPSAPASGDWQRLTRRPGRYRVRLRATWRSTVSRIDI